MKTIIKAINKEKKKLEAKYHRKGLYENFGQNEVDKLKGKYVDTSSYADDMNERRRLIQAFNEWCSGCNDSTFN